MRHTTTRARAAAGILLTALLAAGLAPLGPAPAGAAEGCLSERSSVPLLPPDCGDDANPPETMITRVFPLPADGWIRSTSLVVEFHGAFDDADSDPIGYECQLYNTPVEPSSWTACTSPLRYDDLEEGSVTAYTFRVRAVDTADDAIDLTTGLFPQPDQPDFDTTAATVTFRVDTTTPNTFGFLRGSWYDEDNPEAPMVLPGPVTVRLQTSEGEASRGGFRCRFDGAPLGHCADNARLSTAAPGLHRFTAAAVDAAGNVDQTPLSLAFFVPRNLGRRDAGPSGAWTRVPGAGYFGGDYLETRRYGATLAFPVRNVREVRLLAPAGPGLGSVQVRIGRGRWSTVRLASADSARLRVWEVRDRLSPPLSGPLEIRVVSRDKPVRIDAVSAR